MRPRASGILVLLFSLLSVACYSLPFPYPQSAPIPAFRGSIKEATDAQVLVKGHDETKTVSDHKGRFTTQWGEDFFFGMDQFYYPRKYTLEARRGKILLGSWEVARPALLGWYPERGDPEKCVPVGELRVTPLSPRTR